MKPFYTTKENEYQHLRRGVGLSDWQHLSKVLVEGPEALFRNITEVLALYLADRVSTIAPLKDGDSSSLSQHEPQIPPQLRPQ